MELLYICSMAAQVRVRADTLLCRAPEGRIGLAIPLPLSMRIDDVAASLDGIGWRVARRELIAAALLEMPTDPNTVLALIQRYRVAVVSDAVPADNKGTVALRYFGPGPRPSL